MQTVYSPLEYSVFAVGRCAQVIKGLPRCNSRPVAGSRYCKKHHRMREQEAAILAKARQQGAITRRLWPGQSPVNIYFVQCDDGVQNPVKIGMAVSVKDRLKNLQVSSAYPMRLMASFIGTRQVERQLHQALAEHRLSGEWFKPCVEIEMLIALANESRLENIKRFLDS